MFWMMMRGLVVLIVLFEMFPITLHTKVRRLGYLKLIVLQYLDNDFYSVNSFPKLFEIKSGTNEMKQQLTVYYNYFYGDNKGLIENNWNGTSAEPYIKLAESFGIIARINYSYVLTKEGKVFKAILENDNRINYNFNLKTRRELNQLTLFKNKTINNVFYLSTIDNLFFFKILFENDFIFLSSIIKLFNKFNNKPLSSNGVKYYHVKDILFATIKNELVSFLNSDKLSISEKSKIYNLLNKIRLAKYKRRSYENIVEPRVGWLIDIDIIDGKKHKDGYYGLTKKGEMFIVKLSNIYDVSSFFEEAYYSVFNSIYEIIRDTKRINYNKLTTYLTQAFHKFKTLAPNRITMSQAIHYVCLSYFLNDGIIVEYKFVKKHIFAQEGKSFIVDWFPSENDGSIKLLK